MLKRFISIPLCFAALLPAAAGDNGGITRGNSLGEVTVWSRRPMKEIGVQKTDFDSLALHENVALSMADVLTFNSSVFVKSSGRATLSTVTFRGTSPAHTQVSWNGMRINNPMLGITDFSTIPSFFIDKASLLHGSSSVTETSGGLGGLVKLSTSPDMSGDGFRARYIQGIASFSTFDEFLQLSYSAPKWSVSTRAVYSSSPNDFKFTNHDKKENIYDENNKIIGQYHPVERNRSGAYHDLHLLQEASYDTHTGHRLGLAAWYADSHRELPLLTTDYGADSGFENKQHEQTLRAVVSWDFNRNRLSTSAKAGYIHSEIAYDYRREITSGNWADLTRSRSNINTAFGQLHADWMPRSNWFLSADISLHQHFVKSQDKNIILTDGNRAIIGYDKARLELSGALSAKWQPVERAGISLVVREEMNGTRWASPVPALMADWLLSRSGNLMLKASVSRNHKTPSLNDMYFLPGGNPDLRDEQGWSYDAGLSFDVGSREGLPLRINGSATWFDSRIDDWIIWLPTTKGFFSPRNVKRVHSYGIEARLGVIAQPFSGWFLDLNASYSWTPSVNIGEPMSDADMSVGKQLPYVPRHSASFTGRLTWKGYSFLYKWVFYSQRFTMSSNDLTLTGHLPEYYMNNISLEKSFRLRPIELQIKVAVNNLFNEDYLSVLAHPMPGRNYQLILGISY